MHIMQYTSHLFQSPGNSDKNWLNQPWVEAVRNFGDYPEAILFEAYKVARSKAANHPVTASEILEILEQKQFPLQNLPKQTPTFLSVSKNYGSDGESDSEYHSLEAEFSGDGCRGESDLETDGEIQSAPSSSVRQLDEQKLKKYSVGNTDKKTVGDLKLKYRALKNENKYLKEKNTCRKCQMRPVSVTFLPCGHYSHCYDCGQTFSACPICKKTILADVKTYLA